MPRSPPAPCNAWSSRDRPGSVVTTSASMRRAAGTRSSPSTARAGRRPGRPAITSQAQGISELQRQTPHSCVVPGAVDAWCQPPCRPRAPATGRTCWPPPSAMRVTATRSRRGWHRIGPRPSHLMKAEPNMARIFLAGWQRAPQVGDVHRQPELASDDRRPSPTGGRDAFYTGEIARDMVDYLRKASAASTRWKTSRTRARRLCHADLGRVPRSYDLAVPAQWPGGHRAPDAQHHGRRSRLGERPDHRRPHPYRA